MKWRSSQKSPLQKFALCQPCFYSFSAAFFRNLLYKDNVSNVVRANDTNSNRILWNYIWNPIAFPSPPLKKIERSRGVLCDKKQKCFWVCHFRARQLVRMYELTEKLLSLTPPRAPKSTNLHNVSAPLSKTSRRYYFWNGLCVFSFASNLFSVFFSPLFSRRFSPEIYLF